MKADPQTEAEVWSAFEHQIGTLGAGDIAAYMRCWVPDTDATEIGSAADELCIGHDKIAAMNATALAHMPAQPTLDFHWRSVSCEGPVAWVTAEGTLGFFIEGQQIRDPFRWTMIFVLREGSWLISNSHFSVPDARIVEAGVWPTYIDAVASEVRREEPSLGARTAPDGTITLMFSDIADSTQLTERLGDLRWMDVLREHNTIVRERVHAHGGFEVKTIGDAFMIVFPSARRALLCAIDLQRAFSAYGREHPEAPLSVRFGLHVGEPIRDAGDFFGKSVIFASRVAAQAAGGEILVSALLKEVAETAGDIQFGDAHDLTLKGFDGTHSVYPVSWQ